MGRRRAADQRTRDPGDAETRGPSDHLRQSGTRSCRAPHPPAHHYPAIGRMEMEWRDPVRESWAPFQILRAKRCGRSDRGNGRGEMAGRRRMSYATRHRCIPPLLFILSMAFLAMPARLEAQAAPPPATPSAPPTPRAIAPIDLTGYWVSVVTEDWRFRMITPDKGDYTSVPLNPEGKRVADTWDPDKDTAAGNQCRSYGAAGVMR